ncbi:MAG: hypothetical protein R3C40_02525 [Parvularculaceae bacterium]
MIDFPRHAGLHVLPSSLMWIGGVGFVTLVLLPSISALPEGERLGVSSF